MLADQTVPDSVQQAAHDAYVDAEGRLGTGAALRAAVDAAYAAGVGAGRAQAAADIRTLAEKIRSDAWTPSAGVALAAIAEQAASVAAGESP